MYDYFMYDKKLEVTKEEKYLGVTINDCLTWSSHVNEIAHDANRKLGVIYRGFKNCSSNIRKLLCRQVALSKLDYCCSVWDPHNLGDIRKLEHVQKQAARTVLNEWNIDYKEVLKELSWLSLHQRRLLNRNTLCFKIIENSVDIPFNNFFQFRNVRLLRHSHDWQLCYKFARTDTCKHSFFYQTVSEWNVLPSDIVECINAKCFNSSLFNFLLAEDHSSCNICLNV